MSNSFYNYTVPVAPGTTIRSDKYNTDNQSIAVGFDGVEEQLDLRLKLPSGFAGSAQLPALENSSFIYVTAEGEFGYYPLATIVGQSEAVEGWHDQVNIWQAEVEANKDVAVAAALSAQSYATAAGQTTIITDGGTLNVPNGAERLVIVCLGDATINLPATPATNANYTIKSTGLTGIITINTNAGANDHQIDLQDGNTDYSGTITGQFELELLWLGAGVYRGY